jgi:hypothetical protein
MIMHLFHSQSYPDPNPDPIPIPIVSPLPLHSHACNHSSPDSDDDGLPSASKNIISYLMDICHGHVSRQSQSYASRIRFACRPSV